MPTDKDAKLKMQECEKLVKRVEFLKAIEMGEPPSAAEGLDLDSMGMYGPVVCKMRLTGCSR